MLHFRSGSVPFTPAVRMILAGLCVAMCVLGSPVGVDAQLTPDQRRELTALRREISKISSLTRKKEFDEATKSIEELEKQLGEIATAAGLSSEDSAIAGVQKAIDLQKQVLERAMGSGGGKKEPTGVSFSKEIAPILMANCTGCHGEEARGGLRLDTFAGLRKGGNTGPLLVPGAAQRSLLAFRLVAPGQQRMPRGEPQLPAAEMTKIAEWINQGARFDGDDETVPLSELGKKKVEITVAKPEGNETVSFKDDVAPMLVTFCLGCHSGNNPASGFSVETFEKILIGGDSGEVLIPGKLEDSRLFRLTGGLENPRMPQGQARITRKNYEDLKTWIVEGIKYDAGDPKIPIRNLVPTDEEKLAMQLKEMPEPEFQKYRQERAEGHWRRTLSSAKPVTIATDHFLAMGNVDLDRLQQAVNWADAGLKDLQTKFALKEVPKWRGRLAIYVFKDRYDYEEFNRSIENRQPADALVGHAKVTNNLSDAYVAVLDTGDVSSGKTPALQWSLFKALTSALLQTNAAARPVWLMEGTGWALAEPTLKNGDYEASMLASAGGVTQSLQRPDEMFENGTFAPDATEHVGYATVRFLLNSGNMEQFRRFVKMIQDGQSVDEACRAVYQSTAAGLAQSVRGALR